MGARGLSMITLALTHGSFEVHDWGCRTVYPDGLTVLAAPQDNIDYRTTARRLGYGGDTLRMCIEHEFLHSAFSEALYGLPSASLRAVAARRGHGPREWREEALVMAVQEQMGRLRGALG